MSRRFRTIRPQIAALALICATSIAPAAGYADSGAAGAYLAAEQAARRGDVAAATDYYMKVLAVTPDSPEILERATVNAVAAGRIDGAVPIARRLEEMRPGHQFGDLVLAADALKRGQPAAARALLAEDKSETGRFLNDVVAAWAAFDAGDVDTARSSLAALESDESGGAAAQMLAAYHLGLLEAATGNDAAATEAFKRAQERAGAGTTRLARLLAGSLARQGKVDEARKVIADRLAPTLGDKRLEALDHELAEGRIPAPLVKNGEQGAAEAFYAIAGFLSRGQSRIVGLAYSRLASYLDPDLIEAKLLVAEMLRASEQYDLAIAAYETVPNDVPEALEAMIGRADVMYRADRPEAAIAAMRETVARFPHSIEAQNALGDMLRREERFAEAAVAYEATIDLVDTIEPRHWVLFYQRGICYERSDQWDKAEADFREALKLEPDQPLVLNYLGYSLVEKGEKLDEAQHMIEKAVEQKPDDGYIVDSLGWVLYKLGDFDGAVQHLEKAVELKPVDPVINDHFGDALWKIGRKTEARFQWRRALSFEPEKKDEQRIRRKLEVGLDTVLAEEAQGGKTPLVSATDAKNGG